MNKPLVKITYKTANGSEICIEVETSVKELLEQSDRQIRSQRRQDRRHLDFTVHTDEELGNSLLSACEDAANLMERIERDTLLHEAIGKLTEVQRRRLRLYFFEDLTYSQIARLEGVNYRSVIDTINQATARLKKLYQI